MIKPRPKTEARFISNPTLGSRLYRIVSGVDDQTVQDEHLLQAAVGAVVGRRLEASGQRHGVDVGAETEAAAGLFQGHQVARHRQAGLSAAVPQRVVGRHASQSDLRFDNK